MMITRRILMTLLFLVVVTVGVVARGVTAQDDAQAKIESAMSAAPAAIAEHATIFDNEVDADGKFVVLREGHNGWYCFPDLAVSPGPDPSCLDEAWLAWQYAFIRGEEPNPTVPGVAYMLQGGSDPSNTDPLATEPAAGEDWVTTPPHIMVLFPGKLDPAVFTTDHESGEPYIMWAGTPYEHIMVPLNMGDMEP